ncbi:CPBP family intramembrane metalloprotease [Fulvivirgaceae bacterium PWU5]|uniref:CPBP family intramembrane metalloprotease n=1 Tax=Dawidia cretensis TaxID=2782350 RepID=A0AAP2DVY4_9BACT|nr:type II CAAX endopeptidase family protein [Dawidia cretensis]MBT1707394.1 CPBP family intramembrane metalloprotease [Dawidia cretensis]
MKTQQSVIYPNIMQSFSIAGIIILALLIFAPLTTLPITIISREASNLLYYLCAMGVSFLVVQKIRKIKVKTATYTFKFDNSHVIYLVIAISISLLFGIISPVSMLIPMPESVRASLIEMVNQTSLFTFVLMVIAAPVLEELIFRGVILDGLLKQAYSPSKAIIISSFLFGIVHLNPWQFVAAFLVGLFAGWVFYKTRNMVYPIVIHSTTNLCGYLIRTFADHKSIINYSLLDMYGGLINLAIITVGSVGVIVLCIYCLNRIFMAKYVDVLKN